MRKILALGLVVLLVVVAWSAGWFWAAGEARRQIEALAANDAETAPRITCGTLDVGGFPFRFDVTCADARLESGDETITVKGVKASVMVYNPSHVLFAAEAPYAMANAFTGSSSRFDFTGFEGSARLLTDDLLKGLSGSGWRIGRISIVADNVTWNDTVLSDVLQAKADHVEAHLMDVPETHDAAAGTASLAAYLSAKALTAPAFQIADAETSFEAELSGLPDDIAVAMADPDPIHNWQRRGGVFNLARFAGNQPSPDERFDITGKLSLNPAGLLQGEVSYTGKGVLDRLAGIMPPVQIAMFKGKPEADGGYSNSFTIVDGQLKFLAMTVMEFPPLW